MSKDSDCKVHVWCAVQVPGGPFLERGLQSPASSPWSGLCGEWALSLCVWGPPCAMELSDCETQCSDSSAAVAGSSGSECWAPMIEPVDVDEAVLVSDGEDSSGSDVDDDNVTGRPADAGPVDFDFRDAHRLPTSFGQHVASLGDIALRKQSYLARFLAKRCPCQHMCIECFLSDGRFQEDAFNSWCGLAQCPKELQDALLAQRFMEANKLGGEKRMCHSVVGRPVCRSALFLLLGIGRSRHKRVAEGAPDMRRRTRTRPEEAAGSWQQGDVFSFLWGVYSWVAEFCPNHDVPRAVGVTAQAKQELLAATRLLSLDPRKASAVQRALRSLDSLPRKFLPPGHVKQYYWQYCAVRPQTRQAGYSTFKKVWRVYFQKLLGFTRFSSHPICSACSELKARMRHAVGAEERVYWGKKYDEHQDDQMRDRQVYHRMREASRRGDALCIMQDGSDQSKYRLVRTPRPPKDMDGIWCPRMKWLGTLAHGWVGCFWLLEEDVHRSGPDLTVEALMTVIEETRRVAHETGRKMPAHIWVQLDNTPAENKNRFLLQALGVLVDRGICVSATASFLRVGHTHEDLDGLWGVNHTVLGNELSWDTPEDILGHTRRVMESMLQEERVFVERLDFVRAWKEWGAPLDLKFPAIANGPCSQHFYRFWRRERVPADLLGFLPDDAGLPGDVLMEVRQFMADPTPCQQLAVVLRQGEADLLEPVPEGVRGRGGCAWPS